VSKTINDEYGRNASSVIAQLEDFFNTFRVAPGTPTEQNLRVLQRQ